MWNQYEIALQVGQIWKATIVKKTSDDWKKLSINEIESQYNRFYLFKITEIRGPECQVELIIISDPLDSFLKGLIGDPISMRIECFELPNRKFIANSFEEYQAMNKDSVLIKTHQGMSCRKCLNYNEYAECNQADGSFLCYSCRN